MRYAFSAARIFIVPLLAGFGFPGLAVCAPDFSGGGWPQWRGGPLRDGVALQSPKLLDAWPTNGPTLLWKSAPFEGVGDGGHLGDPNAPVGGCGSVSVADGKACFYVHCKRQKERVSFTTADLTSMGWMQGMTTGLAVRVDKAYKFNLVGKPELEAHIKGFLDTLDPADVKQFGDAIRASLSAVWDRRISWGLLMRLEKMRDREYKSIEEWNQFSGDLLHGHAEHNGEIRQILNANGFDWTDVIVCLDAATGRELWKRSFPGRELPSFTYGFLGSSTPALADGRCCVAGSAGVYCLALADGKTVWQVASRFSNSSPLAANDAFYLFLPDGLTAFQAVDGKRLWCATNVVNSMTSGSVALWKSGGRDYLLGYGPAHKGSDLFCVAAESGAVQWRTWGEDGPGYTTPAVAGDMAVSFGKGAIWAFRLTATNGAVAWTPKDKRAPRDERGGSVCIYNGCVYAVGGGYGNSGAHCFDLATGELKWTQKYNHTETPSPVIVDGKLIANANIEKDRASTVMLKASPDGYGELGRLTIRDDALNFWASPVVAQGRLYLRLRNTIACYDLSK